MYNIWGFFLQTIAVSIVAGIMLLLKRIFEDKLSPKWQYGIWTLFAIRILVPVNLTSYVVPQLALGMEVLKAYVESQITSVYSQVYEPITVHHIIPIITKTPQSITDWLFAVYIAGVVCFLLRYFISYIRLRTLLKRGNQVSNELEAKLLSVCDIYGLKVCKIIAVNGLSSAFICGIFRPVLVVPTQGDVNEKVLIHELLHLKHHDTIQNVGWCMLRSLHWCNPLMHFVVNQIENDMESLCDQRVLELLEGEERREYGIILLDMANQKYARIPGTTSISNGGNNISKRIAAIVRFKKYPQGMALVSVCIILTLFWPTIIGSATTYDTMDYMYYNNSVDSMHKSMAIARINRCGTVAGAIDMYAKGVYKMNGAYVASASPFSEHARIAAELEEYGCYQPGKYVANIQHLMNYSLYNLDQIAEKEYIGTICYYAEVYYNEYVPELKDAIDEEDNTSCAAYIFLPVSIIYNQGWCVKENGERWIVAEREYLKSESFIHLCSKEYYGRNDNGEFEIDIEVQYKIDSGMQSQNNSTFLDFSTFDTSPNPNAHFTYYGLSKYFTYTHFLEEKPRSYVEFYVKEMKTADYFEPKEFNFTSMDNSENGWRIFASTTNWEGTIRDSSGGGYGADDVVFVDMPSQYLVDWNIAGEEQEEIILKEVAD